MQSLCCVIVHIVANSTFQPAEADVALKILDDHSWVVFMRGRRVSERGGTRLSSPLVATDGASIRTIIDNLERSQICIGNPDECWRPLSQKRKGQFKKSGGDEVIAFMDQKEAAFKGKCFTRTIRHVSCDMVACGKDGRCRTCRQYRATLRARNHREKKLSVQTKRAVVTRTNNRYTTTPDRVLQEFCQVSHAKDG